MAQRLRRDPMSGVLGNRVQSDVVGGGDPPRPGGCAGREWHGGMGAVVSAPLDRVSAFYGLAWGLALGCSLNWYLRGLLAAVRHRRRGSNPP
jgi:hypothetical protein